MRSSNFKLEVDLCLQKRVTSNLHCASAGLATVIRAWFDRVALSQAMGLDTDKEILLAQTVGVAQAEG